MKTNKAYFAGFLCLFLVTPFLFGAKKTDYMEKANAAIEERDYDSAVEYLEKAYKAGNMDSLLLLGDFYTDGFGVIQDPEEGLSYYEEALDYYSSINSDDEVFYTLYTDLGFVHDKLGEYAQALEYYNLALEKAKTVFGDNSLQFAEICNYEGGIYYVWDDYEQALFWSEKALKIAAQIEKGNNAVTADCYNNLANIYFRQSKFNETFESYNKAISIWQNLYGEESESTAIGYYNLSALYLESKKYDEALKYADLALKIQKNILGEEHADTAATYSLIGAIYKEKKDFKTAVKNYEKALDIFYFLYGDYHTDVADTYYYLGFLYYDMKNYKKAIENLEFAFDSYEYSEDYNSVIQKAWTVYEELKDIPSKYKTDYFYLKMDALTAGISAAENMRNANSAKKQNITEKALPLYYAAVDIYAEDYEEKNSFYYSELLRSRGFLEEIGTEAALKLDGITDKDRNLFNELNNEVQMWTKKLSAENKKGKSERKQEDADKYTENLIAARKKLADFDEDLGKRIPKYMQLRNPEPVSFDEAKKWCGKDKVILEYVISEISSYCLVVTNKSVSPVKLDSCYDYSAAVEKLRNLILERKTNDDAELKQIRKELYGKLIEPVTDELPFSAKNILVVPDGALAFIPFDVLEDEDGVDFGENYNISLSPSVSVSMMAELNSNQSSNKILALGNAVYDQNEANSEDRGFAKKILSAPAKNNSIPVEVLLEQYAEKDEAGKYYEAKGISWTNIPGTGVEIHNIQNKAFKNADFDLLEGKKVSEANIKTLSAEKKLKEYSIIHFACHGYFDPLYSQMSSLVLSEVSDKSDSKSQDGYLTLSETSLLDITADFVNLSACQTGLASLKKGDGMTGLSRSLLVSGAKNVGVTLWSVDDEATCEFMTRMYTYVSKNGLSYKEAYSKVKSQFRQSEKWNSPYFWAAFVLYE